MKQAKKFIAECGADGIVGFAGCAPDIAALSWERVKERKEKQKLDAKKNYNAEDVKTIYKQIYIWLSLANGEIKHCIRSKNGKKIPIELLQHLKTISKAIENFEATTDEMISKAIAANKKRKQKRRRAK